MYVKLPPQDLILAIALHSTTILYLWNDHYTKSTQQFIIGLLNIMLFCFWSLKYGVGSSSKKKKYGVGLIWSLKYIKYIVGSMWYLENVVPQNPISHLNGKID